MGHGVVVYACLEVCALGTDLRPLSACHCDYCTEQSLSGLVTLIVGSTGSVCSLLYSPRDF